MDFLAELLSRIFSIFKSRKKRPPLENVFASVVVTNKPKRVPVPCDFLPHFIEHELLERGASVLNGNGSDDLVDKDEKLGTVGIGSRHIVISGELSFKDNLVVCAWVDTETREELDARKVQYGHELTRWLKYIKYSKEPLDIRRAGCAPIQPMTKSRELQEFTITRITFRYRVVTNTGRVIASGAYSDEFLKDQQPSFEELLKNRVSYSKKLRELIRRAMGLKEPESYVDCLKHYAERTVEQLDGQDIWDKIDEAEIDLTSFPRHGDEADHVDKKLLSSTTEESD